VKARAVSRRRFVTAATAGMAGLGMNRLSRASQAPRSKPKYKYIDIHIHLGTFFWGKEVTLDGLLKWMDEHSIERGTILPLVSPESTCYIQTTEAALAAYKKHPDRIIPFCCIDPRAMRPAASTYPPAPHPRPSHVNGLKGMIDVLQRWKDMGCKGLGEHKVGLPIDHPLMMTLYEACQVVGLPVLFHLDDIRCIDEVGFPHLKNVLEAFPNLPLIGHECGFWAGISGDCTPDDLHGYPKRPIAPGGAIDKLMDACRNLYCDLSGPGGVGAFQRDMKFGREFLIRRQDHVLFGTDYLMPGQDIQQFEVFESLDLPDEVKYKIYRGNAIKLLDLDLKR
jgi:hypothetical protein